MKRLFYYVILALFIAAGTGLFLYGRYGAIKTEAIEAEKTKTAAFIQNRAAGLVRPEDFSEPDTEKQQKAFGSFWRAIQSPELVRIKVWDPNLTIIWSNLPELVGQRFPDNRETREALEGEVEFEVELAKKSKLEYFSERQYTGLSETYVPFRDAGGKVVGVFEVYQPTNALNQIIRQNFIRAAIPTAVGAVIVFILLALMLRFFLRTPYHNETLV